MCVCVCPVQFCSSSGFGPVNGNIHMKRKVSYKHHSFRLFVVDNASEDEYKDLASELKIIIHLGEDKNIVNLLGACTTAGDLNVILECCPHGDLLSFLRARREIFSPEWNKRETDMEKEFTYIDLVMISHQVSKGMDFLQSRKVRTNRVLISTFLLAKINCCNVMYSTL